MKRLLKSILMLAAVVTAEAQDYTSATLATNTPVALLTDRAVIRQLTLTATTANNTTFKFYDNNDATAANTNIVYAATVSYASYATNITDVITNTAGVKLTNTFSGTYTYATVVNAVTNERPRILTITVPASSQRVITPTRFLQHGLVAQANYAGLVEVEYEVLR